ncbi:Hypothetical_protein [Hexamita inflata]|uniref:Hypothetical_protein n=1 Tax=Hexamita inflata TaxID=28002 RepID=A0AA86RG12_9EUKA|nr:Hypothetical protein HINF_LOCUS65494 [Hexamita inflata]
MYQRISVKLLPLLPTHENLRPENEVVRRGGEDILCFAPTAGCGLQAVRSTPEQNILTDQKFLPQLPKETRNWKQNRLARTIVQSKRVPIGSEYIKGAVQLRNSPDVRHAHGYYSQPIEVIILFYQNMFNDYISILTLLMIIQCILYF